MDTDDVWHLVERARTDVGADPNGGTDAVAGRMVELLARRDPAEIVAFAQPLWDLLRGSYRADLWAAAYVINGGASDDGFDYFRGWLIGQGRAVYEAALADPDSLAGLPAVVSACADGRDDLWGEDILDVAWNAHRVATGTDLPPGAFSIRLPALDPAWDFDFDDSAQMRRRLPRLARMYYGAGD
jgi:hypothetical protein